MSSSESHPSTTRKIAAARTRWAAIGAATAVTLGAGGLGIVGAADDGEAVFKPIQPCRMVDSRTADVGAFSTPIGPEETRTFEARGTVGECELPQDAVALSINLTSVNASTNTFFTAYPAGSPQPNSSQLNPNDIIPISTNGFDVTLSASGEFSVYNNSGTSHMFVDVLGVYTGTGPLVGPAGENGENGENGNDGIDGSDGPSLKTFYADSDGDTYGDPKAPEFAYEAPDGHVTNKLDCDDSDADVNPDGVEANFDGIDSNCDGAEGGIITRANLDADGAQSTNSSDSSSISADGNLVAFSSYAGNLVADDTNGQNDVFVKNLTTGDITLVTTASDGTQGDNSSQQPSISADGNLVAFTSNATNLVADDTNRENDVFVKNLTTGDITLVTTASDGTQSNQYSDGPSISADGNFVAFRSNASNLVADDTNNRGDVFVKNVTTGDITLVSAASDGTQGDNYSYEPAISADGTTVAFYSDASNLVADDTNNRGDVFVKNVTTGDITLVSAASDGTQGDNSSQQPSISADGNLVAFRSNAANLVAEDTNGQADVFVKNVTTGEITLVSAASDGTLGSNYSNGPSISADGNFVAFNSYASNLVDNDSDTDSDVFVKNLSDGSIVSVSADADDYYRSSSYQPAISADGRFISFSSDERNLVEGDTNGQRDIFVADRGDITAL